MRCKEFNMVSISLLYMLLKRYLVIHINSCRILFSRTLLFYSLQHSVANTFEVPQKAKPRSSRVDIFLNLLEKCKWEINTCKNTKIWLYHWLFLYKFCKSFKNSFKNFWFWKTQVFLRIAAKKKSRKKPWKSHL